MKNFSLRKSEIMFICPRLVPPEGRTRRHLRGAGCDGRGACLQANGARAYGQAAWSCPPDAGVKFANDDLRATEANKPGTPGRSRSSRKAIAQGVPCDFGQPVVTTACVPPTRSAHKAAGA